MALIVLAKPILMALYGSRANEAAIAVTSLRMLGIAALFVSLAMPINSMLQAIGKINTPAKLMIIGVIFKLLINNYLIAIPTINIKGAPIGTIVCYAIVVILGLRCLLKSINIDINIKSVFIKPIIASAICIASAHLSFQLLSKIKPLVSIRYGLVALLISIIIAVIIYIISLILLNALERDDINMLPGGKKIIKRLEKYNFLG